MLLFKSCPKCTTGDLVKARDVFGEYLECIQCGYMKDLAAVDRSNVVPSPQPPDVAEEPPLLTA